MATGKTKPASDTGFHEKNFRKLKEGKLWEYIASRGLTFFIGVMLGFLYIRDAAYVHSKDGVPHSIIFTVAIIFFMNGMRKMMWGFVKMNDAAWDDSVAEKPHHPDESALQRFFMRLPGGNVDISLIDKLLLQRDLPAYFCLRISYRLELMITYLCFPRTFHLS